VYDWLDPRSSKPVLLNVQRPIDVSPQALVLVAATCCDSPFLRSRRRAAGILLRASDVAWSSGTGPEVTGPLASLILAITGRAAALDDLAGDGLAVLRRRIG
jgi:hypothetical protein